MNNLPFTGRSSRVAVPLAMLGALTLALLAGCGQQTSSAGSATTLATPQAVISVVPERELVITDLSVVEDPVRTTYVRKDNLNDKAGIWSFGRLMEQMAGSNDPAAFTLQWLQAWESDQSVNGFNSPARPAIRSLITDPWLVASGCAAGVDACKLDFSKAPFRLLAITNRTDLRQVANRKGDPVHAGEGRFVFGAIGPTGNPLAFTVIFEYRQKAKDDKQIKEWGKRWHDLGAVPFGEDYNKRLQAVTTAFAGKGAMPERINGSAINQIRTNEASLAVAGSDPANPPSTKLWELREFNLTPGGMLAQVTVKQNPDLSLNGTSTLAEYINANEASILGGTHVVPSSMLGASAITPGNLQWTAPGTSELARREFALDTCSGCHLSETGTAFLHIKLRNPGVAAPLSTWLATVDLPRRADDLRALLDPKSVVAGTTTTATAADQDGPAMPSTTKKGRVH